MAGLILKGLIGSRFQVELVAPHGTDHAQIAPLSHQQFWSRLQTKTATPHRVDPGHQTRITQFVVKIFDSLLLLVALKSG
jgi:hypothetical protein